MGGGRPVLSVQRLRDADGRRQLLGSVCNGARAADTGTTFSSSSPHFCMSRRLAASAVSATVAVVAAAGGEIKIMYTFLLSVCHSLSFSLGSVLVFCESSLSVCVCARVHA